MRGRGDCPTICLEQSEVFKQTILNSMLDEIVVFDGNGTIVAGNRAWVQ